MNNLITNKGFNKESFLNDYIAYMTTNPAPFNDSYAEEFHRTFFYNYKEGKPAD